MWVSWLSNGPKAILRCRGQQRTQPSTVLLQVYKYLKNCRAQGREKKVSTGFPCCESWKNRRCASKSGVAGSWGCICASAFVMRLKNRSSRQSSRGLQRCWNHPRRVLQLPADKFMANSWKLRTMSLLDRPLRRLSKAIFKRNLGKREPTVASRWPTGREPPFPGRRRNDASVSTSTSFRL